jgi:hypothetical protein
MSLIDFAIRVSWCCQLIGWYGNIEVDPGWIEISAGAVFELEEIPLNHGPLAETG